MSSRKYELVIEGHEDFVKGFLRGVAAGANKGSRILFNNEHAIDHETIKEKLKEFFDASTTHTHVVLDESTTELIENSISNEGEKLKIKVLAKRVVKSCSFKFKYKAYAENYGTMLKAIFQDLPEGISVSDDYAPKEVIHPEAKGPEAYAPEHNYVIKAKGTIIGDFDEVLSVFDRCVKEPLINLENIALEFE